MNSPSSPGFGGGVSSVFYLIPNNSIIMISSQKIKTAQSAH